MRKEQILQFIPNQEDGWASTHQIALKAKQHDFTIYAWLVELKHMPRPLVEMKEGGQKKKYRYWRKTQLKPININEIESKLPTDRTSEEHKEICKDKFSLDWNKYINQIIHAPSIVKI